MADIPVRRGPETSRPARARGLRGGRPDSREASPVRSALAARGHAGDLAGEVDRLVALGAQRVGDGAIGDSIRWVRMLDPEGNEFDLGSA